MARVFVFFLLGLASQLFAQTGSHGLASGANYRRIVEPLLLVTDFGMHYYEDGAADATVTAQNDKDGMHPPVATVQSILRLGGKAYPALIDCLSDGRLTAVRFDGNTITNAMQVPVGYVCLDILMATTASWPIWEPGCDGDGLGACVRKHYYFRPDDYWECRDKSCQVRPWVLVVQRSWRGAYLGGRLHFRQPFSYKDWPKK